MICAVPKRWAEVYACTVLRESLQRIKRQPSLLAIEVAWRWAFGAAAIALLAFGFVRLQRGVEISPEELSQLASGSPDSMLVALGAIGERALPILARLVAIIVPSLFVLWVVAASVGRAVVLAKLVGTERVRLKWSGVIGMHLLRALSFVCLVCAYVLASVLASLLFHSVILVFVFFLLMFAVAVAGWVWVHWVLSLAVIYPVTHGSGTFSSLRAAHRLVWAKGGELASVATANGTARSVVALVFTIFGLLPLPLYRVAPGVLIAIEVALALVYCVISDWFLLARLAAYLGVAVPEHVPVPDRRDPEGLA